MNEQSATATPNQSVALLVGTMKGAFLLRSDEARKKWRVEGPHFQGFAVYALMHDGRAGRNRTFAAANNPFFGSALRSSEDHGRTWSEPERYTIKFPDVSGREHAQHRHNTLGCLTEAYTLNCDIVTVSISLYRIDDD